MIGSAGVSAAQSSLRGKQGASQAKSAAIAAMKEQASGVSKIAKKVTAAFTSIVDEGNKREAEMRKRINSRLLDSKKQLSAIK